MSRVVSAALVAVALTIGGCASAPARTPGSYVSQGEPVYLITEAQADQILVDAMNAEFGAAPIVRVEYPHKGYQATIKFVFDSHQIVATMVPSKGVAPDGSQAMLADKPGPLSAQREGQWLAPQRALPLEVAARFREPRPVRSGVDF